MIPDWQLPPGVDRGLWDYFHSEEMVAGYDAQMADSPLAACDVRYCERWFPSPGVLVDLGCGTGRLAVHFARKGYSCTGVDLSPVMLKQAQANAVAAGVGVDWVEANLTLPLPFPEQSVDYAACLFSTLGMVQGQEHRLQVLRNAAAMLKPGGIFVLHVHNRWYPALGWKRFMTADLTMPQAYGGAPLTLHHFTRQEVTSLCQQAGFTIRDVTPVAATPDGRLATPWCFPGLRAYGYLLAMERQT